MIMSESSKPNFSQALSSVIEASSSKSSTSRPSIPSPQPSSSSSPSNNPDDPTNEFFIDTSSAPPIDPPSISDLNATQLVQEIQQVEEREGVLRQSIARQQAAIDGHDEKDKVVLKFARYKKEQLESALMLQGNRREELKGLLEKMGEK
jgi:hypothetical protein